MTPNTNKDKIDFIGIGAPRSGTTWLSKCLEEHPDIFFPSQKTQKSRKELFFFNIDKVWIDNPIGRLSYYNRGINWYLKQFPPPKRGCVRGEFSVSYMADPLAYKRIKKYFPDIKILAILRNPTDMIYSLHWHFYHGAIINIPKDFAKTLERTLFIEKGFYFKHLKKFYETFPKENIHVILLDDVKKDPLNVVQGVYKFLGVNPDFKPPSLNKRINTAFQVKHSSIKDLSHIILVLIDKLGFDELRLKILESQKSQKLYTLINKKPAEYPPMSEELRKKCTDIYLEDITNLEKLLNRDLSAWKGQKD